MKIAICGSICSGKTTLSEKLKKDFNLELYSFAFNVKKYCNKFFNMNYKNRKLIQDFAEKMKEIDENIWINLLDKKINNKNNIIIDDLRFKNEYNYLKSKGFYIIKLNINKEEQIKRIKKLYKENYNEHLERLEHISELDINNFKCDLEIESNDNLYSNIRTIINF